LSRKIGCSSNKSSDILSVNKGELRKGRTVYTLNRLQEFLFELQVDEKAEVGF